MNHKIRHNQIRIGQQAIVLRGQTDFSVSYYIFGGRKTEKHDMNMREYVQGQPWRKACSAVCELARALVNRDRSMKSVLLPSQLHIGICENKVANLQQLCSYVASYRANDELVIPRMFSHERLHQSINEGDLRKFSSADYIFPVYGISDYIQLVAIICRGHV